MSDSRSSSSETDDENNTGAAAPAANAQSSDSGSEPDAKKSSSSEKSEKSDGETTHKVPPSDTKKPKDDSSSEEEEKDTAASDSHKHDEPKPETKRDPGPSSISSDGPVAPKPEKKSIFKRKKEEPPKDIGTKTVNSGTLYIRVVAARTLPPKANPFVIVTVNNEKQLTLPVIKKTREPEWPEKEGKKTLFIEDKSKASVLVTVFSQVLLTKKFLGKVEFDIKDFQLGVPVNKWYNLEPKKKDAVKKPEGAVHLHLMFMDKSDKVVGTEFDYPLQTLLRKRNTDSFRDMVGDLTEPNNTQDKEGLSAVHVACLEDFTHPLELLIKHKYNLELKDDGEQRAIHKACYGSVDCLELLLEAGVDSKAPDVDGNTPLHIAAARNQPKCIKALIDHNKKLSTIQNNIGDTPLALALKLRCTEAISALVEGGADIFIANKDKWAPVDIPGEEYHKFLINLSNDGKINIDQERITEEIKAHFIKAIGANDPRELVCLKTHRKRHRMTGGTIAFSWQIENPQFLVSPAKTTKAKIITYFPGAKGPQNEVVGCSILAVDELITGDYKVPSHLLGITEPTFTMETPITYAFEKGKNYLFLPFTKYPEIKGDYQILVFTEEDVDLKVKELKDWPEVKKTSNKWEKESAGGAQPLETWINNPHFSLTLPVDKKVKVCLMLSQSAITSDMHPLGLEPYPNFIGYYLYDRSRSKLIGQSGKWLNARDVWTVFELNTAEVGDKFLIIPCTKDPVEKKFRLTVLSDLPFKLKKAVAGAK